MHPRLADLILFAVTAVWGLTFPLVKGATDVANGGVPTYWFLAARFSLAFVLLAAAFWPRLAAASRATWGAGLVVGALLFAGFAFQTFGLTLTTSAKAGFITGLYVVLVPILSFILLRQKPTRAVWLGVATAGVGLALLSLGSDLGPTYGDFLVFLCAIAFALHIVAVSRYAGPLDPIALAIIQIGVVSAFSWVMQLADKGTLSPGVPEIAWWSAPAYLGVTWLYCGILATGAAYLLQNLLQPYTTPTHTALIFAAEPIWAAIFAYLMRGEQLTTRGYLGAALILVGMLLSEIPTRAESERISAKPG